MRLTLKGGCRATECFSRVETEAVWEGKEMHMTYDGITSMLEEAGLPLAYDHFSEGESPDPPFLIFLFPGSRNFKADGRVYQKGAELHIELYADRKDPPLEKRMEDILDSHGIVYEKSEVWIESERMYEVLYSTEVLMDDGDGAATSDDDKEVQDG